MAQFLLSVWHDDEVEFDPSVPPSADMQRQFDQVATFNEQLRAAGAWVFAGGLHGPSSATVIRARDREVSVTEGPYAPSKEHMGGFWVIDVPDRDAALDWARRGSTACEQVVEVRPFHGE